MKRILILYIVMMEIAICFAKSSFNSYEYNIVGIAIAKEGYYLVEVSAIVDKKKDATLDIVKKCSIHGCLFKGFAVDRIYQKPILSSTSIEQEHQQYFVKLFNEKYNKYVNYTQPIQIVKVEKRYRVKAIVIVAKEILRKDLENEGIIRKLGL